MRLAEAEEVGRARRGVRLAPLRQRENALDVAVDERAVGLERIEGAGRRQRLQRALVERLGVEPRGEVGERAHRALPAARSATIVATAAAPMFFKAASE